MSYPTVWTNQSSGQTTGCITTYNPHTLHHPIPSRPVSLTIENYSNLDFQGSGSYHQPTHVSDSAYMSYRCPKQQNHQRIEGPDDHMRKTKDEDSFEGTTPFSQFHSIVSPMVNSIHPSDGSLPSHTNQPIVNIFLLAGPPSDNKSKNMLSSILGNAASMIPPGFLGSVACLRGYDVKPNSVNDLFMDTRQASGCVDQFPQSYAGECAIRPQPSLAPILPSAPATTIPYPSNPVGKASSWTTVPDHPTCNSSPTITTSQSSWVPPPVVPVAAYTAHESSYDPASEPTTTAASRNPQEDVLASPQPSTPNGVVVSIPVTRTRRPQNFVSRDPVHANLFASNTSSTCQTSGSVPNSGHPSTFAPPNDRCAVPSRPVQPIHAHDSKPTSSIEPTAEPTTLSTPQDPTRSFAPHPHQVSQLNMLSLVALQRAKLVHYDPTGSLFPGWDHAKPAITRISPAKLGRPEASGSDLAGRATIQRSTGEDTKVDGTKAFGKAPSRRRERPPVLGQHTRPAHRSSDAKVPMRAQVQLRDDQSPPVHAKEARWYVPYHKDWRTSKMTIKSENPDSRQPAAPGRKIMLGVDEWPAQMKALLT